MIKILRKHEQTIIAIAFVSINFLVKGVFLSSNSLGGDEPFSIYHAQMDIASIIRLLSEGNNPPLYEILLHFWIKLFGISEFSVRFPSLIFSSITVLYIYRLGIKHLNKRIALYASIVFIFSNYHILLAHEARSYSLLGMLSIISMYYFMGLIHNFTNPKEDVKNSVNIRIKKELIVLILVDTLLIYTHYFGFFILITQFLFLLFNKTLILKNWKQLLMSAGLIGLLYIPNMIVIWHRFVASSSDGTWIKAPNGIDSIYNMLRQFTNAPVVAGCIIILLASSLAKHLITSACKKTQQKNNHYRLIVFWFAFIFVAQFLGSYLVPMFIDRYLMIAAIAFSLMLGISADSIIKAPKYNYIIPSIVCILFIATAKPNITNKRDVKEVVEKIKSLKDSNTQVIICPAHFVLNFCYYYDREIFKNYNVTAIYSNIDSALSIDHIYSINNIKEVNIGNKNHLLFLDAAANFSYPDNNIKETLNQKYNQIGLYKFYEIFSVYEYRLK